MAITNASDLLVYAKTASAASQVTRIYVKETNPLTSTGTLKINNVTNSTGVVSDDVETGSSNNDGASVLAAISTKLVTDNGYTQSGSSVLEGDYRYREYTNGATGIVPTLEIVDGTASIVDDGIIISIETPGSSAVYDAVAFSTQASYNASLDLRDCTNKDSGGYAEYKGGLKSFEVSTELLQSINPDVPLDGTDFFHELSERDEVNIAFSDRIRNIILTNTTTAGVDGFTISQGTQTTGQNDPFGGTTASKFVTPASTSFKFVRYSLASGRVEDKRINWSFYIKGTNVNNTTATFALNNTDLSTNAEVTILEGSGSLSQSDQFHIITGLDTSDYTRISFSTGVITMGSEATLNLALYPGLHDSQDSDELILSSWQIELLPTATAYQDPTTITQYQGNALVTSVNFDAGVEENLTCSATFTGTGITTLNT